jgi:hypothetical protein
LSLVIETVREALPTAPEWLLSTRLDNDDGLHSDFIATVQRAQTFRGPEILNCPAGVVLRGDRVYRRVDRSNAFISLSEPFEGAASVLRVSHIYAGEAYPVRQVTTNPMWVQVVHGANISNKVRGWRVPIGSLSAGFQLQLSTTSRTKRDSATAILAENLTLSLLRSARDQAVRLARRIARLFGIELRRRPNLARGRFAKGKPL